MTNQQILINLQSAIALLPKLGEHIGIAQSTTLITAAMNIHDFKIAEILINRAVADKNAVPSLQSEALRYKAKFMFLTNKIRDGRQAYKEALNILNAESAYGINELRASITANWIILEFQMGECSTENNQIRQFIQFIHPSQILPLMRSLLITTLKSNLADYQMNNRCSIPEELKMLN